MLWDMCLLFVKTLVVIVKSTVVPLYTLHKWIVIAWIARTAKDREVTAHANPTFAWANLATEQERQLTGKRVERTKRDFRSKFAALPLVKLVVRFERDVVNWRSRSVAKSA